MTTHRATRLIAALTSLSLIAPALASATASSIPPLFDPKTVTTPPLHPIPNVKPERSVLKNGMVVYLLEDHSLPVVSGRIFFKASTTWAPDNKAGLGEMTASVIRSGGSAAKTGDYLDDRLGALGASISSTMNADYATSDIRCLTENATEIVGLWGEVLRHPAYPDDKLELARVGMRRSIASRNDDMQPLLIRTAGQAVFGKDSPYARNTEYATIEAITREDCIAMHSHAYAPNRAIAIVYGDFKAADMKALLTKTFGDWAKSDWTPPAMPPMPALTPNRVVFAPKNDVTQSGVVLAHLGFKSDDPDLANMDVLEQALGGGFRSRLFNLIRTQRGLAYATGANSGSGFTRPGVFTALTLTRNDSVMAALDLMKHEVVRITKEPMSDLECQQAREAVQNGLVFSFERPAQVVFRAGFYELAGYPADFLQRYQKALAEVTPQSLQAAAARKIHPENLITVVVGKESEFDRPLTSIGPPVERVDITIPPPPSKVNAGTATPQSLTEGRAWLQKAAAAAGGPAAWAAVKTWSTESEATLSMQGQSMVMQLGTQWKFPDHMLSTQKLPMGEMTQGFDGKAGWRKGFGQLQDQPDMASSVEEDYARTLFNLFGNADKLEVQALPDKKTVDGVAYSVALVKHPTIRDWQLYFAPDGRLARMDFMDKGPGGEALFTQTFDDWRALGNLQYPYASKVLMAGQPFMDAKVTSAKVNPALDEAMFKKPAN